MEGARASGFAEEVLPHSPKKSFEKKGAEFPLLRFQPSQLRGVRRPHGSVGWSFENDGTLSAGAVWGPVAPQPRRRRRPVTPITVGGRRVLTSSRIDATYRPRRDAQREGPGRMAQRIGVPLRLRQIPPSATTPLASPSGVGVRLDHVVVPSSDAAAR